jgi:hypothetical protein
MGRLNTTAATIKLMDAVRTEKLTGKAISEKAKSFVKDFIVDQYPQVALMKDIPNKIYDGTEVKNVYAGDNELTPNKKFEPSKKDLAIGDTVPVGNAEYRVIGYDADGEPLVESE